MVVAALLVGGTGCSLAGGAASGCTVPKDEAGLLKEYARDPVFAVVPSGAHRVGGVEQSRGCKGDDGMDLTQTSASVTLEPGDGYGTDALHQVYDPVAARDGWRTDKAPKTGRGVYFTYCRSVRGVTSVLSISTWPGKNGGLYVKITAWPERTSCASPLPSAP